MMDAVDCYTRLYGGKTLVMRVYFLRFALENPNVINLAKDRPSLLEGGTVDNLAKLNRREFLEVFVPAINRALPKKR